MKLQEIKCRYLFTGVFYSWDDKSQSYMSTPSELLIDITTSLGPWLLLSLELHEYFEEAIRLAINDIFSNCFVSTKRKKPLFYQTFINPYRPRTRMDLHWNKKY